MKKLLSEMLADVVSPEKLNTIEETTNALIEEKVNEKAEQETERLELLSEQYIKEEVEKQVSVIKESLQKDYEEKVSQFESDIIDHADQFLDEEVVNKIPEDVIKEAAEVRVYKPLVEGIKKVFSENGLELNTDGSVIVKEAEEKVKDYEKQLDESKAKNLELIKESNELKAKSLIAEKSAELTPNQKEKFSKLVEGKDLADLQKQIDTLVEIVTAKEEKSEAIDENEKVEAVDEKELNINKDDVNKEEKEELDSDLSALVKQARSYLASSY